MGMYTSLNFKVKLKKEFVGVIEQVMENHYAKIEKQDVKIWGNIHLDFIEKFSNDRRSGFIPFGALASAWSGWKQQNILENDIWTVTCSLKNYDSTIVFKKCSI